MGTKNDPGTFDCYANAAADEPMFVLLARDRHAPILVRLWALLRQRADEDPVKIAEALQCADAMEAYAKTRGREPLDSGAAERLYFAATKGMKEHPENFDGSCDCNLCRSYA